MDEKTTGTETKEQPIPPAVDGDAEARIAKLEEEKENYRKAYLKADARSKENPETDDERVRRIAQEELANSRLAEITREQDEIIKKALKENRELKLAQLNGAKMPPATGAHSEGAGVRDTLVTPEQMEYFKNTLKWSDKDIERYKKNLLKAR